MDNNSQGFKLSLFGFKKKDVIDYIEKLRNDEADYRNETDRKIAELEYQVELLTQLTHGDGSLNQDD